MQVPFFRSRTLPSSPQPKGYVFLVGVLVTGAVATATVASLLLLGLSTERNAHANWQSNQADAYASSCIEFALKALRDDLAYPGDTTKTFSYGSCTLLPIEGYGVYDRELCAVGVVDRIARRWQVRIDRLLPTTKIESWEYVENFSLCQSVGGDSSDVPGPGLGGTCSSSGEFPVACDTVVVETASASSSLVSSSVASSVSSSESSSVASSVASSSVASSVSSSLVSSSVASSVSSSESSSVASVGGPPAHFGN